MNGVAVRSTIWAGTPADHCATPDPTAPDRVVLSGPTEVDLYIYRGDSGRVLVHLNYPDGAPIDVSAATWDCDIRAAEDSNPPVASLDVVEVDANTVELILDAATSQTLTDGLVWDLEMRLGGEVQTLMKGHVHVQKDVSRP